MTPCACARCGDTLLPAPVRGDDSPLCDSCWLAAARQPAPDGELAPAHALLTVAVLMLGSPVLYALFTLILRRFEL